MPRVICFIFIAALAGLFRGLARAQDSPTDQPATRQIVWHLTDYLNGTPQQIQQTLNHEVQRQTELRKKAKADMDRAAGELASAQKEARDKLDQNAEYQTLAQSVKQAEAALNQARQSGTPEERLAAGSAYIKLKQQLEKMQHDAIDANPAIAALQQSLQDQAHNFDSTAISIGKAEAWRRELLDALDNAQMLMWPMAEKSEGVLRIITPKKIIGKDSFEAAYISREIVHQGDVREGIVSVEFKDHPVLILVSGIDTTGMQVGKSVELDTDVVQVVQARLDPELGEMRVLRALPGDLDTLLKTIHKLDVDIPQSQLDEFVKLSRHNKADAKQWSGIAPLLASLPRDPHSKAASTWTNAELDKANELLRTQVPGDTMQVSFIVRSANLRDDGTVSFVGTVETADGRVHDIEVNCPASYKERVGHIKEGARIQAKGMISRGTLHDDGTLYIELSDASF